VCGLGNNSIVFEKLLTSIWDLKMAVGYDASWLLYISQVAFLKISLTTLVNHFIILV
jgi:hypothetical protein